MVRISLPVSNAFGDSSQYQELAVSVSDIFQVSTFCMYSASLNLV